MLVKGMYTIDIGQLLCNSEEVDIVTGIMKADRYNAIHSKLIVCGANIVEYEDAYAYRQGNVIKINSISRLNSSIVSDMISTIQSYNISIRNFDISAMSTNCTISSIKISKITGYDKLDLQKDYSNTVFKGEWTKGFRGLNIRIIDCILKDVDMTGINWGEIPVSCRLIDNSTVGRLVLREFELSCVKDMVINSKIEYVDITHSNLAKEAKEEQRMFVGSEINELDMSESKIIIEMLPILCKRTRIEKLRLNKVDVVCSKCEYIQCDARCSVGELEINDTNISKEQTKWIVKTMKVSRVTSNVESVIEACKELKENICIN